MNEAFVSLAPGVSIPRHALRWHFARSGGPGGQNVNKVNTKAELRVRIQDLHGLDDAAAVRLANLAASRLSAEGDLLIASDSRRSQFGNREECIARLSALVDQALRVPKKRKRTKPTRASQERRLEAKRRRSRQKEERGRRWE